MRKTDFCIADQHNQMADRHLCFHFFDRAITLIYIQNIRLGDCTGQHVSDLVGNPEDQIFCDSQVVKHIIIINSYL